MNRYEIDYYDDVSKIKETLKRIAKALEVGNVTKAKEISGENTGLLTTKAILDSVKVITDDYASKHPVDKLQGANDIPLTITNLDSEIPNGPEETKDYDKHDYDNKINHQDKDFDNNLGTSNKELHELKLHTDEGQSCGDDIVHNDYLTDLVQEMNKEQYIEFCQEMSYVNYDLKVVQHSIDELEYKECLGAIKQALAIIGDDADDPNLEVQMNQDEDHPFEDPYTYDNNLTEYKDGIINDSDFNLRKTAKMYTSMLNGPAYEELNTKKDCILDYVTNEFGTLGARYSDITKFAYYLGSPNCFKHNATDNRGYYSLALAGGRGHLVKGGKDQLVKGINNEGGERYFALSFVESATDYWKRIK